MEWLKLGLVLFAVFGNISAQEGYNYERPQRPFEPTRYQTGSTQQQSSSPTTPTITSNGYQTPFKQNGAYAPGPSPQSGYERSNGIPEGGQKIATTPTGYPGSSPTIGAYPESPTVFGYQKSNGIPGGQKTTPTGSSFPVSGGYPESPTVSGYQRPNGIPEGGQKIATTPTGYPGSSPTIGAYPESSTVFGYQKTNGILEGPRTTPTGGSSFPVPSQQPGQKLGNIFQAPSFRPYPGQQDGNFTSFGQTPLPVGSIIGPFVNGQQEEIDEGDYSAIPGEPGQDYPIYSEIPTTSFSCNDQQYPGYYADTETRCQVFHICANNKTYDFLCPNGTVFHQEYLVCVWWNQFDCSTAPSLYSINANIYDYTIMGILEQYQGGTQRYPQQGLVSLSDSTGLTQPSGYPGSTQANGAILPTPNRGYPAQRRPGEDQGLIGPPGANMPGGYLGSTQANGAIFPTPNRGYPAQRRPGDDQGLISPPSSAVPGANLPGGTGLTQPSGYPGSTQANGGYPAQKRPSDDQGLISPPSNAVPGVNPPGGTGGFLARPGGYSSISERYPLKEQPGNYQESDVISGERQQVQLPKGPGNYPTKPQPDATSQQLNGYPGGPLVKQPGGSITQQQKTNTNGAIFGLSQKGGTELPQGPGEYPGTIQGYPREQPLIPFPGTKSQQPNRAYLPPVNGK